MEGPMMSDRVFCETAAEALPFILRHALDATLSRMQAEDGQLDASCRDRTRRRRDLLEEQKALEERLRQLPDLEQLKDRIMGWVRETDEAKAAAERDRQECVRRAKENEARQASLGELKNKIAEAESRRDELRVIQGQLRYKVDALPTDEGERQARQRLETETMSRAAEAHKAATSRLEHAVSAAKEAIKAHWESAEADLFDQLVSAAPGDRTQADSANRKENV